MGAFDIWDEIQECSRMLDVALEQAKKRGYQMVEAEAACYTAKTRTAYQMERDGKSASFIGMVIKGMPGVSEAMELYHRREVEYRNANEAIMTYKKQLDMLREQYAREWGAAKEAQ